MWRRKHKKIGKNVGGVRYVHRKYIDDLDEVDRVKVEEALAVLEMELGVRNGSWNILRFVPGQKYDPPISFMTYKDFDEDPHPELIEYYIVDAADGVGKRARKYPGVGYILHRKELMVGEHHPDRDAWQRLTAQEESVGLYDKEHLNKIGRLTYWYALLETKGVTYDGHVLRYTDSWQRVV